jgi:CMP-N,N'-diacetyllegionaminic acid synthase
MINEKEVLVIIPARGGSKGVKRKNIRLVNGKPLIYYAISESKKSKYIDRIIVSTDNLEIKQISKSFGAEVIDRPKSISRSKSTIIDMIKHTLKTLKKDGYNPDIILLIPPTSPLRTVDIIDKSIETLLNNHCDTVLTVNKVVEPPQWMCKIRKDNTLDFIYETGIPFRNRQDYDDVYIPNSAVTVTWTINIYDKNSYVKDCEIVPVIMDDEVSIDINTELDLFVAEQ